MIINKSRIRSVGNYLNSIEKGKEFYVGVKITSDNKNIVTNCGFTSTLEVGETILPMKRGTISDHNANGSFIKLKDLPKETVFREMEITDWHGYTHWVDVPYKRYQREELDAPNIELTIVEKDNVKMVVSPCLNNVDENYELIRHVINLQLELFGFCEILSSDLSSSFSNIRKLNWKILPPGEFPWDKLKGQVETVISKYNYSDSEKKHISKRIKIINSNNPDFVAIGHGGFHGYMIFGFESKEIYLLESTHIGNATYVLGKDWKVLSTLTKKEILDGELHKKRIIHRSTWETEIKKLMN